MAVRRTQDVLERSEVVEYSSQQGGNAEGEVVYLDYAATTPIDDRVMAAMEPYHGAANASSSHGPGRGSAEAVERARAAVAALVGARPGEIVFTSGATEADNLAIGGVVRAAGGGHVVTTAAEHKAVLETAKAWCDDTTVLPVRRDGSVDPSVVRSALRRDTVLVSVMAANNEVGTLSDLEEIGKICRDKGVLFHTDAAQAAGKVPLDVGRVPLDLMSLSAHKLYGPKGVGALWVRRDVRDRIRPLMFGGGHERGLRPGTINVAGCVGFGQAASIAQAEFARDTQHCHRLRGRLLGALFDAFKGATLNGHPNESVPCIINVCLPNVDAESLLLATPTVAASTGSACTSAAPGPSHVLISMGLDREAAGGSLRLSFGRFSTPQDVDRAVEALSTSARLLEKAGWGVRA